MEKKISGNTMTTAQTKSEIRRENAIKKRLKYDELAEQLHGKIRANKTEYVICAANWYQVPTQREYLPKNIDYGVVVCGRSHHNIFATVAKISEDFMNDTKGVCEQGFLTSKDRWVDRKEAGEIAFKAGQTTEFKTCLFSEDLY